MYACTHLEDLPSPVLVHLVPRDVVEVPQALDGLRPQQVVRVVRLDGEVLLGALLRVEVGDLGRQVRLLAREGQVARVGQLLGERQVLLRQAVQHAQGKGAGEEAGLERG